MKILGIDPGSRITGYGVIEAEGNRYRHLDNGIIRPKTTLASPQRLHEIYIGLCEMITLMQPHCLAIEEVFVAKNARSALVLGQARGIALLAAAQHALPIHEYATRTVKQCVVGNGNARKDQIQFMTQRLLALPEPACEDAADALALAICHAHHKNINQVISRSSTRARKKVSTFTT